METHKKNVDAHRTVLDEIEHLNKLNVFPMMVEEEFCEFSNYENSEKSAENNSQQIENQVLNQRNELEFEGIVLKCDTPILEPKEQEVEELGEDDS